MGERSSNVARTRQAELKQQPQQRRVRCTLRHAPRSQPRLRDRAPGSTPEVHPALPDPGYRDRSRQDPALPRGHAARAAALRGQGEPGPARAEGARPGGRGLRDRLDRRARPAARPRRAGGGGVLLQPDEVARLDRVRRVQGRGVVRDRQRRRAAQHPRGQARCQAVPAHRRPQHRQRLAAVGQVRRRPADAREIVAAAAKLGSTSPA